jgi:hypothetical protein
MLIITTETAHLPCARGAPHRLRSVFSPIHTAVISTTKGSFSCAKVAARQTILNGIKNYPPLIARYCCGHRHPTLRPPHTHRHRPAHHLIHCCCRCLTRHHTSTTVAAPTATTSTTLPSSTPTTTTTPPHPLQLTPAAAGSASANPICRTKRHCSPSNNCPICNSSGC